MDDNDDAPIPETKSGKDSLDGWTTINALDSHDSDGAAAGRMTILLPLFVAVKKKKKKRKETVIGGWMDDGGGRRLKMMVCWLPLTFWDCDSWLLSATMWWSDWTIKSHRAYKNYRASHNSN